MLISDNFLIAIDNELKILEAQESYTHGPGINVISANPAVGDPGQTLDVQITGDGFQDTAVVDFSGTDVIVNITTFISSTLLQVNITIDVLATLGFRNITVTNFGGNPGTGVDIFEVVAPAPLVTLANPSNGNQGETLDVTITGAHFQSGATAIFSGTDATVNLVSFTDTEHLVVNITIDPAAVLSVRDITVTNPDTKFGIGLSLFTVTVADPTISKILPASVDRGQSVDLEIFGSYFQSGATVIFSGTGITVNAPVIFVDNAQLIVNVTIASDALLTARDVTVTNPDAKFGSGLALLTITATPPSVFSINPSFATQGETASNVIITGEYFQPGAIVAFSGYGVAITESGSVATFVDVNHLSVTVLVAADAECTARSVYVTNPDINQDIGTGLFTINPLVPDVISVNPSSGEQDLTLDLFVIGLGFQDGATVEISGDGITYNGAVTFVSSTQLALNIDISVSATLGARSVTVTNPNSKFDTGIDILTILSPQPRVTSVTPATGYQGDTLDLVIIGEYFQSGATVNFSGTGIIVEFTNYISSTRLDARINIASDAFISKRDIFIKNPGENVSVSLEAFEVIPLPITVDSIDPVTGRQGEDLLNVQIVGTNFQAGAIVEFSGAGISVTSISSVTATKIQCDLSIASDSIPSVRDVIVRNLDSGEGTGIDLFTVTSLPPEVLSVDPTEIERDQTVDIDVIGTRFYDGATVVFSGIGITTNLVTWISTELLTVNITLASDTLLDLRDITVVNVDLQEHTGLALLEIIAFPPTLLSILPTSAVRNESHLLTLTGTYFQDGAKVEISDIGMVGPVTALFIDSVTLQIAVFISAEAVLGLKDVTVINPDNKQVMVEDLLEVVALAPLISNVSPASNSRGQSLDVVITGSYFQDGAIVVFSGTGITINGLIIVDNSSQISANIAIDSSATLGLRDVTVTNPDVQSGTGVGLFEITALNPIISGIVPFESERNVTLDITVHGSYFQSGVILTSLGSGITINSSSYLDSERIAANITIAANAVLGFRAAFVTNIDGGVGSAINVFKVVEGVPTITSIDPNISSRAQSLSVSVTGSNFQEGATVLFSGTGIGVNEITFIDSSQIDLSITISFDAELTARDVTVINPDNKQVTGIGLFTIAILNPIVNLVIPDQERRGKTRDVQIIGSGFQFNPIVSFSDSNIVVNEVIYVSGNQLTVNIAIAVDTSLGFKDVTVTNTIDAGTGIGINVFEIVTVSVLSVSLVEGKQGQTLDITITGENFQNGTIAEFSDTGIIVNSTDFIDFTQIKANISIDTDAELSIRDVTVINVDGGIGIGLNLFTVVALEPLVTLITPKYGEQDKTLDINIFGYYFQPGVAIEFSDIGIAINSVVYVDRNHLVANISIATDAPKTTRDVTVTNPDTLFGIGLALFTVTRAPVLFSVKPIEALQGETIELTLIGDYFQSGSTVSFSGDGIVVDYVLYMSSTSLKVGIIIVEDASLTVRDVTITNANGFFCLGEDFFAIIPSYPYIMELDLYDKWGESYSSLDKKVLNDFYQQLVFLLVDEHIYDNSKIAVGYKNEDYIFTGRYNINSIPISEDFVPSGEGSSGSGNVSEEFLLNIDNSLKFLSSVTGEPEPDPDPEPEPYEEGIWTVYHNNQEAFCEVTLNKVFHTFSFALPLNRGQNSIKIIYETGIEKFVSSTVYVNAYNIHLLLQMYSLEFLDYFKTKEQIYSDQYLYDTTISSQSLKENFASMLKLIRESDQDINQFRSFIEKGVESYWSALTIKGLSKLFEAYETNWRLEEYYKNRVKLSNTSKLSSDGSLNIFWLSKQIVLNKRHYYLTEGSLLLAADTSFYLYTDEETDANGYLLLKQNSTLPSEVKVRIDAPVDYIEMQVKENITDFNDTDWTAVTEYFTANLAYSENAKFFYVKFRKANKEISPIYYKVAEYFLLGLVKTGASSILSIDDGKISMSSINTKLMCYYGFELFLEEPFDNNKQERVIDVIKSIKPVYTKGYVIFDKKVPASVI